jgi:UDP-glucose 4-epimerase
MSATEKTILITGGAGFIGSHLSERLVAEGHRVIVVDDLSTGRLGNLRDVAEQIHFIEADVLEGLDELRDVSLDEIYHLAAAVGVRLVVEEPIRTIETNVEKTSELLRWAARRGVPTLIASSSEVYGKSDRLPFAESDDVIYGSTESPRWSYALSKAIDEYLALAYQRRHGLPVVVARFFNTVGPRQIGAYGMVVPRFVRAAMRNEDLTIYGDGSQTRCFCDVRDVARVLPVLARHSECHGRVFNVGSDRRISIADLASLIIDTLGSDSACRFITYEEAYGPNFEDLQDREPDLTRLREACGFEPTISLEQTIRDLAAQMQPAADDTAAS